MFISHLDSAPTPLSPFLLGRRVLSMIVASNATAWSTRDVTWSMVIAGIAPEPERAQEIKDWAQEYWKEVHPFNCDGGYINFISTDSEPEGSLKATYGDNYEKLVDIKTKYDPNNVFHVNHNIQPTTLTAKTEMPSMSFGQTERAGEAMAQ